MATATSKSILGSIKLPKNIGRHTDILFAISAIIVIMMLIIPLPTIVLDFLLIVDIVLALLILLMVLSLKNTREFSVFPSILLIMTAFRLALNVSTTRAILTQGVNFNGKVITAFADFVVSGNVVVGVIIFTILILVQFLVITKGATRVAEVAARFSLDSMPAKMMAVESELQAGAITDSEAEQKRRDIRGESDFFGTMDGASKFVQGDVVAGIIITFINVIGGLVIGMAMRGESFDQAINAYVRFTVGDGLVTQIPSFFMSFATGLLLTRGTSEQNLSTDFKAQVFDKPKNLYLAGGFSFFLMFLPGFPKLTLLLIAAALIFAGYSKSKHNKELGITEDGKPAQEVETKPSGPLDVTPLLKVERIELSIGTMLIPLVDESQGGDLLNRVTSIRRELALDMGIVVPPIRITDNNIIEQEEYTISINGTETTKAFVRPNMLLAFNQSSDEPPTDECEKTNEPAFGLPAYWISADTKDQAESKGFMIFGPTAVIATHLTQVIRNNANVLLGREEVQSILNLLKETHPSLTSEVLSAQGTKESPLGYIQKILQNLLQEGVAIRNSIAILEAVADAITSVKSEQATELVRSRLGQQISQRLANPSKVLKVIILSQQLQNDIAANLVDSGDIQGTQVIGLSYDIMQKLIKRIKETIEIVNEQGYEPVFLVSSTIRRPLYNLIAKNIAKYSVIATVEVAQGYKVESLAVINI